MKVLVIAANAFSKIYNNGKTLEAIFAGFRPDELAQLFTRPQDSAYTDYDFCNEFYVVSEMDQINRLRFKTVTCGGVLDTKVNAYQNSVYSKFKRSRIKKFGLLRDALWGLGLWKNKVLNEWLKRVAPDIIFIVGGGSKYLHSIGEYAERITKAPIVLFYTDDYLIHPEFKGIVNKFRKWFMNRHYHNIIAKSKLCFAIGDKMSGEYQAFFCKTFHPIMNSLPYEPYKTPKTNSSDSKLVISYFGGLHLNRWRMISRIGSNLPANFKLRVFTSSEISEDIMRSFRDSKIEICGCVNGERLREEMLNSDLLLHVESDDDYNRSLTYLSVSTKIPEYLMTGRAIIGYGPQEVASMQVLSDHKIGFMINSDANDEELGLSLKKIASDREQIVEMGKRGYRYAIETYNGERNAEEFRKKLETLLSSRI